MPVDGVVNKLCRGMPQNCRDLVKTNTHTGARDAQWSKGNCAPNLTSQIQNCCMYRSELLLEVDHSTGSLCLQGFIYTNLV